MAASGRDCISSTSVSIDAGSISGSSPWTLMTRSTSEPGRHLGHPVGPAGVVRPGHGHLAAEAAHRRGDPLVVCRHQHPVHPPSPAHGLVHVLDQRFAGFCGERFPGESGGGVTRGE